MAKVVDGNRQEMSVLDKDNASLAATEEGQDMSRLERVVVPMPQFVNPNDPNTNAGSINMSLDAHPVEHAEEYGHPYSGVTDSPMSGDAEFVDEEEVEPDASDKPRDEWTKADYKEALAKVSLPVSGNLEDVKGRYEEFEAQEAEYKDYHAREWIMDVDDAETADDLAELKAVYVRSGAEFKTVDEAFSERESEFSKQ
jgi:hypothetical protein